MTVISDNKRTAGWLKAVAAAVIILGTWLAMTTAAYADEAIRSVTVTVTSSVTANGDGGSVSATADSTKYHVVSCDFINGKSQWKAGDIPKASIELAADEG